MSNNHSEQQPRDQAVQTDVLVLPLERLDRSLILMVGGKAAQLGELMRAGFAVPNGFCVTTTAYARVNASPELDALLAPLSAVPPEDTARQAERAAAVRSAILQTPVSSD